MRKITKQETGQSHQYWLDWVGERSINKNTFTNDSKGRFLPLESASKKPPFPPLKGIDATKDITEKDMVRNRYMGMVAAAIYHEQIKINDLEEKIYRKNLWRKIKTITILSLAIPAWIIGVILFVWTVINY